MSINLDTASAVDHVSRVCPLCHTPDQTTTGDAPAAAGRWQCLRCAQIWTTERLAVAVAYAQSVI